MWDSNSKSYKRLALVHNTDGEFLSFGLRDFLNESHNI